MSWMYLLHQLLYLLRQAAWTVVAFLLAAFLWSAIKWINAATIFYGGLLQ